MKKEGGSTSETEADRQSSDEGDIHDFSTYSYIEDSDDADIENVEGFNEENVQLYVIDGRYLPHRIVWNKQSIYCEIIQKYINYVESHYGKCNIAFGRYQDGPLTKNYEHA